MLFDLPDFDVLYAALLARDPRHDGQAWVCVTSTGVFCRLSCPARKPLAANCRFQSSIAACIEGGYRPCKRCHPVQASAGDDPAVTALLALLDAEPGRRWREQDLLARGHDLSTVRRSFKRQFGMTFLEMARQRRLREGFHTLMRGDGVLVAQQDASFASGSAFRLAFARLLGCAPGQLRGDALLRASWIPTPLGDMLAVSSRTHLHLLQFIDGKTLPAELKRLQAGNKGGLGVGSWAPTEQACAELGDYFAARAAVFNTPLAPGGTAFSRAVWAALQQIPPGQTRSYAQVAGQIGQPTATRAVARANGANPIALMIPCHRVIGSDGSLTGYAGGLWRKQRLIEIERTLAGAGLPDAG